MDHVTGTTSAMAKRPLPATIDRPLGRITVDYIDGLGTAAAPLNRVPVGTYVTAAGTVSALHQHGTAAARRATFVLTSNIGESTVVAVGSEVYARAAETLADGITVQLRGTVCRPFHDMPPYIQMVSVRTLTADTPAAPAEASVVADLADALTDLQGFRHLPGIAALLDGIQRITAAVVAGALSTDDTQTVLAVLAGDGPNITSLLAETVAALGDSATNPALLGLPEQRQDEARELTAQYLAYDEAFAPRDLVSETCASIQGV